MHPTIETHTLKNGDRTATCGAWIVARKSATTGAVRIIDAEAPAWMQQAAREALQ